MHAQQHVKIMKYVHVAFFFGLIVSCAFLNQKSDAKLLSRRAMVLNQIEQEIETLKEEEVALNSQRETFFNGVRQLEEDVTMANSGGEIGDSSQEMGVPSSSSQVIGGGSVASQEMGVPSSSSQEIDGGSALSSSQEIGDGSDINSAVVDDSGENTGGETWEDVAQRMRDIYGKQPDDTHNVEEIITKYQEQNLSPDDLERDLTEKYGEPETSSVMRFESSKANLGSKAMMMKKKKLTSYYAKYNPERMNDVAKIIKGYRGDMERLSKKLKAKYGMSLEDFKNPEDEILLEETEDIMESLTPDEAREELLQTYAKYESDKLPFVDALVDMYAGREAELVKDVKKKFRGFDQI